MMKNFDITNTQFSLMLSFYAIPNIVFPIFAGVITDKFGNSTTLILAQILTTVGHLIVSEGIKQK